MKITYKNLDSAVEDGILSRQQADNLWQHWESHPQTQQRFTLTNVLYYAGGLIIISAMGWLLTSAWEDLGGLGIFSVATAYGVMFLCLGAWLWHKDSHLQTPGGLLITAAIFMVPLITYGFQRWTGIWAFDDPGEYTSYYKWVKGGWFAMEVATLLAGLVALRFFSFPFLSVTIAFTLWFVSMDVTPIILGNDDFTADQREKVSLVFGLIMIAGSYLVDLKKDKDFAFWGYLFGTIAFWGGLTMMNSYDELSKFIYFLINVGLVATSLYLRRVVFIVFGTLGIMGYGHHLASRIFDDSITFSIALSLFGLLTLFLGIAITKNQNKIEEAFSSLLPNWLHDLRPNQR